MDPIDTFKFFNWICVCILNTLSQVIKTLMYVFESKFVLISIPFRHIVLFMNSKMRWILLEILIHMINESMIHCLPGRGWVSCHIFVCLLLFTPLCRLIVEKHYLKLTACFCPLRDRVSEVWSKVPPMCIDNPYWPAFCYLQYFLPLHALIFWMLL